MDHRTVGSIAFFSLVRDGQRKESAPPVATSESPSYCPLTYELRGGSQVSFRAEVKASSY